MNAEKKSIEIISDILGIDESEIKQALHSPEYAFFKIPKKTGGVREIHAPQGCTRAIQDSIYHSFLKKVHRNGLVHKNCFGGIPTKSIVDNVNTHAFIASDYVLKIDLKDAFHCVDKETVQGIFYDVILLEISEYRKRYLRFMMSKNHSKEQAREDPLMGLEDDGMLPFDMPDVNPFEGEIINKWDYWNHISYQWHGNKQQKILYGRKYKNSILFPYKKVQNFRGMITNPNYMKEVNRLAKQLSIILAELTTHEGRLTQGCPTSPLIMALAVTKTNLMKRLWKNILGKRSMAGSFPVTHTGTSVYVDDITFSFDSSHDYDKILQKILSGMNEIEKSTIWKFNRKKVHLYVIGKEQPLITGLRLVTHRKTKQELKQMVEDKIKGSKWRLRAWEPWLYFRPTIPKTLQRKIRAVIHQGYLNPEDETLQNLARSYIGYVLNIYPMYDKVPLQIRKPIDVYLQNNNLFIHHQVPDKVNNLKRIKIRIYKLKTPV